MAEDNELNREIAVTLLEEQGAAITTAENGREAVELFQNAPQGTFDAVLMDVMMPEMNGLEATRVIRAFEHCPPESGIPIIAMTANVFCRRRESLPGSGHELPRRQTAGYAGIGGGDLPPGAALHRPAGERRLYKIRKLKSWCFPIAIRYLTSV